ncbi:MAG: hypothetical protein ABIH11_01275 [Candidatus Altiarchaeota archaeon]
MIGLISNIRELNEHAKKSGKQYKQAIIEYYRTIGESQGFTTAENSSVINNTVNYGNIDLVWIEPNIVFCIEFGLLDDIYKHFFRLIQLRPSLSVLILSSNSKCRPDKVEEIIKKTPELKFLRDKTVIVDVNECSVTKT